ncbi:MAG: cyclase [Desulfatitalea sp.]|nr:cyclase family protein [Desulfatitalea sp.]NNK00308.1 cyclase [Desulfatitalea sp.]
MDQWICLSYFLGADTPGYGGESVFENRPGKRISHGDSCNTSYWSLGNHLGTHVDFPRHFFEAGKASDDYEPGYFIFSNPFLLDISPFPAAELIEEKYFQQPDIPDTIDILLIKTGFCDQRHKKEYWQKNPGIVPAVAAVLRRTLPSLRCIGFDFISISSYVHRDMGREAHRAFLAEPRSILLIEDMDLRKLDSNSLLKELIVAPLLIKAADAAPCTVFARILGQQ